jgi:hypothetical protein
MVVSRCVHVVVQPESPGLEAYTRTAESAIRVSAEKEAKWRIDSSTVLWMIGDRAVQTNELFMHSRRP